MLIQESDVVFTHFSTSLGWAIYHSKPVLLVYDDVLLSISRIKDCVRKLKDILGVQGINVDHMTDANPSLSYNKAKYRRYIKRYIKGTENGVNSYNYAIMKIIQAKKQGKSA